MTEPIDLVLSMSIPLDLDKEADKEHWCCRCAGYGHTMLDDGSMPCYHCLTKGKCKCREEVSK